MRISASERQSSSKKRQVLWKRLGEMQQNTESMRIAPAEREPDATEKIAFGEQEQAKLLKQINDLERGCKRQRTWVRGERI
jgi:hypothetical protein